MSFLLLLTSSDLGLHDLETVMTGAEDGEEFAEKMLIDGI